MSITERITRAKFKAGLHITPERLAVHMGIGAYRQLKREASDAREVAGLPVKVNLNMADGEIVLRYEVKA